MKKISVIVNCHNGEKYLANCIKSIINQTYDNFEVILFDNCSSDKSKKITYNFKDDRIRYYRSKIKLPLYKARNEAIRKTTGDFIAFLDVDDWWDKNYLASRKDLFNKSDYDFFYNNVFTFLERSKTFKIYKNYNLPSGKIYNFLAKDYFVIISGLIIRKKIFDKIGGFDPNLNIIGDFDFVMRSSKNFNYHALNEPLIFYRVHENNFSKLNSEMFFKEFLKWFEQQNQSGDKDFIINRNYFEEKLNSLEINYLLLNEKKNLFLFKKIIKFPNLVKKIKYLVGFFLPKRIIKLLKK
jgi:glycosyltransferase involved in cell wall biosynthesis